MKNVIKQIILWPAVVAFGFFSLALVPTKTFNLYSAAVVIALSMISYSEYKKININRLFTYIKPVLIGMFIPVLVIRILAVVV